MGGGRRGIRGGGEKESIDLLGRHVTEFLYCMVAYES